MRSLICGLIGICLSLPLLPQDASARTDPRASAQASTSSRAPAAGRPVAVRSPAAHHSVASTAASRQTATRPAARAGSARSDAARSAPASQGQLISRRATPSGSHALRSGQSRHAVAVPYSRQAALPARGLRQTAMASCTTRGGRRVCSPAITRTASMRWTGGLAPAAMSQAGCPDGTIATMAIGHNDITRCVPL